VKGKKKSFVEWLLAFLYLVDLLGDNMDFNPVTAALLLQIILEQHDRFSFSDKKINFLTIISPYKKKWTADSSYSDLPNNDFFDWKHSLLLKFTGTLDLNKWCKFEASWSTSIISLELFLFWKNVGRWPSPAD
jgi:hypothetical protein